MLGLSETGEYIDGGITLAWKHDLLLDALEERRINLQEVIKNTSAFNLAKRLVFSETVMELPEGHGTHANGTPRRSEEGLILDMDKVRACGIDPSKVLIFRVTQPSEEPKPEFYWTTDFIETRGGLGLGLGSQRKTAVILVDTLESVYGGGEGLIRDVNDDSGVALRQIGLQAYDQAKAIAVLPGWE